MRRHTWHTIFCSVVGLGCKGGDVSKEYDSAEPLIDPEVEVFVWGLGDRPDVPDDPTNRWADDETAAWFGRYLYFDTRLSSSGTVSCATCHDPALGFGDGLPLSKGVDGQITRRHAPNIWNAAYQRWMYWDGRCDTLWCQAAAPIEAPGEMNLTRVELARLMAEDPELSSGYTAIFGRLPDVSDPSRFPTAARPVPDSPEDPDDIAWQSMTTTDQDAVTEVLVNVAKAIAAYERTVISGETSVDRFIAALDRGDRRAAETALDESARLGLELFTGEGECVFCHAGWLGSNKTFHNVGLPDVDSADPLDTGRYDGIDALRSAEFNAASRWSDDPDGEIADRIDHVAQTFEQLGQFRTPAMRRVAHNAPYMHGGHFETLAEVVAFYNSPPEYLGPGHREELLEPRGWSAEEQLAVVAFLEALSDDAEPPASLLSAPSTPLP